MVKETKPYEYTGAYFYQTLSNNTSPRYGTTTTYDVLNRVTKVTTADNVVVKTFSYNRLTTSETDAQVHTVVITKNVWGNVRTVDEPIGPDISYDYDLMQRLTTLTSAGNVTTIAYDYAGRKYHLSDKDTGDRWYEYDGVGNLACQKDAKNQSILFAYDELNRLVGKDYLGTNVCTPLTVEPTNIEGYDIKYYYDGVNPDSYVIPNSIGKRTGMKDLSGWTSWAFDARGNMVKQNKTVFDGINHYGSYEVQWAYDSSDEVTSITLPNGDVLSNGYDAAGRLQSLDLSTPNLHLADLRYDQAGRLLERFTANGVATKYEYYQWNELGSGRLKNLTAGWSSAPSGLQNLNYTHDKDGMITKIINGGTGETFTYEYDALHRLAKATGRDSAQTTIYLDDPKYSDTTGNFESRVIEPNGPAKPYSYGLPQPHAVSGFNGISYSYDPNGNLFTRTEPGVSYTFTHDQEGQLSSILNDQLAELVGKYGYDGDGKRVLAVEGDDTTVYISDLFEVLFNEDIPLPETPGTGQSEPPACNPYCLYLPLTISQLPTEPPQHAEWRTYYYAGGSAIAMKVQGGTRAINGEIVYLYQDHLGSVVRAAGTSAPLGAEAKYGVWGAERTPQNISNLPTAYRYTGQQLAKLGLYYYDARWFDPALGRFLEPDSIAPDPYNVLDLDRYAYARYSPTKYTDPSGHAVSVGDDGGSAISKFGFAHDDEYLHYWRRENRRFRNMIPKPKQLTSSTWSFTTVKGGMTVGQGGDAINYNSDYESTTNSGNSDFYVNNWTSSPEKACRSAGSGAARAICFAPVILDTAMRVWRPKVQTMQENVGWEMTFGVHNGVMEPIEFNIWTTDYYVTLTDVALDNGTTGDYVSTWLDVKPVFGGGASLTDFSGSYDINSPLTVSATVRCNRCYNTGQGPFSMNTTGSTIVFGKP